MRVKRFSPIIAAALKQLNGDQQYYEATIRRLEVGLQTMQTDFEANQHDRERRYDTLLVLLGIWLGLSQVCPSIPDVVEPFVSDKVLNLMNTFLLGTFFGLGASFILFWWLWYWRKNRSNQ